MAETGYGCVFGDCTSPIDHILTTLSTGASVSLCAEHYAPGLIPLLAAELGVDPGDFYGHVERYLARETKKAEKALADAQAVKVAKGSQGPAPAPDTVPGDDDGQDNAEYEETGLFHGAGEEAL